jgi:hypothetical protein
MVLVGHAGRLAEPLTRRQRRGLAAVGAMLVIAALGVTVWLATHKNPYVSRNGCVYVMVAGPTGGDLLNKCGAAARAWCASELGAHDLLAPKLLPQCRLAGIYPKAHKPATSSAG